MSTVGQEVELTLTALAYGGEAIGRLADGRAAFVPYALPGERVRAGIEEDKRGHVRAALLKVLEPSPERIQPRCPHFTVCGGCHYQHLSYERQLQAKTEILKDQLQRIGKLADIPLHPIIASPMPFNYRNHIQFHQASDGRLGFQAARSGQVIPIQECHLPEALLNQLWPLLDLEPIPGLERIALRLGLEDEVQVILESSDPEPFEFSVEDLPLSAVHLGPGGSLVLAGSPSVTMEISGRPFQVSAGSFFQVNTLQAAAMVQQMLEHLPLGQNDTLLDVYCGVGLFSAFLAPKVRRLVGIEVSPPACADFAVNLDEFDHVELYQAPAEDVLTSIQFHPQAIIVDPPRSGLDRAAFDGLVAQQAPWLAYVSCDPATLGRDAQRLIKAGYHLVDITPFDLFPQTYHIESLSLWQLQP